jgi:hypothetical protein
LVRSFMCFVSFRLWLRQEPWCEMAAEAALSR